MQQDNCKFGLMLPGGGARDAYQVGVLKALSEFLSGKAIPFPIVAGTSAGSINAAVLASHAGNFSHESPAWKVSGVICTVTISTVPAGCTTWRRARTGWPR